MYSLLTFKEISKVEKTIQKFGKPMKVMTYEDGDYGLVDFMARWLIDTCDGRQNKYVNCLDWDKTKSLDSAERGIKDLTPSALDFVFTMTVLCLATKDNANIPIKDNSELCRACDYQIPGSTNMSKLIPFSHRVGLNQTLADAEKFVTNTCIVAMVDKSHVVSPETIESFYKQLNGSGKTSWDMKAYTTSPTYGINDLEGLYTTQDDNGDVEIFESTLNTGAKVPKEVAQILQIVGLKFNGFGRMQEALQTQPLCNWLSKSVTAVSASAPSDKN